MCWLQPKMWHLRQCLWLNNPSAQQLTLRLAAGKSAHPFRPRPPVQYSNAQMHYNGCLLRLLAAGKGVAFEATSSGSVKYEEVDLKQALAGAHSENGASKRPNIRMQIPR